MSSADPGKTRPSPGNTPAQKMARRLIESRQPERQGSDGLARATAVVCDDLYVELSRWVGLDGCHALFTRALAEARTESGALDEIQLRPGSEPYFDGVAESILSLGDAATAEALEAMLVHVVDLLGRLIGHDMARTLMELSIAAPKRGNATLDDRRARA